ncbi:MAG: hypothetical protein R3B55_01690 [Candidatus Paceibacterota bacterium]
MNQIFCILAFQAKETTRFKHLRLHQQQSRWASRKILSSKSEEDKNKYFKDLDAEIKKDQPAIFIYSPDFIYLTDQKVKNIKIDKITIPSERLTNINDWYMRTEKVWDFLNKQN